MNTPSGHGRMEYVAGLVVAVIIVAIGLNFLKSSAERIWNPEPVEVTPWVVAALIAAIPVKLWMFFFYRSVGRKIRSTVLSATAFDSLSDIMTTLVVLLSVLLSLFTSFPADGYAGLLVAALIIWGGVKVVCRRLIHCWASVPTASWSRSWNARCWKILTSAASMI